MPSSSHPKTEAVVYQAGGLHAFSGGAREELAVECYPLETAGILQGCLEAAQPQPGPRPIWHQRLKGEHVYGAVGTHWFLAPTQRSLEVGTQEKNE